MYVILTSKSGQFRTETGDGIEPRETYDYLFYGQRRARFVIAELTRAAKIRVIDETPPGYVNDIPARLLPKFASLDEARAELRHLTSYGRIETALERIA
ncbi:MAG TPA: ferredoxin [Acetobacteraceae bacterium]|nr:ferredoxin [Acetobacteraceae bacterium]